LVLKLPLKKAKKERKKRIFDQLNYFFDSDKRKCDPILEKMVKGGEEKNEFFRVLIENAFKRRLNGFYKRLNEFQKR